MSEDYYETLGVARTATAEDIKRAYRKLAHQHHPDKTGGDEEKFKKVNAAYEVLSDTQKRAQYDQFGPAFDQGGGVPNWEGVNINFNDLGGMGDIFEQFFGGRRGGRQVRRGQDVGVDITISFAESASGVERDVTARLYTTCDHCHGNGAEPGTPIKTCAACEGSGVVTTTRQTMLGAFRQSTPCPTCSGEGKRPEQACKECRGEGRTLREQALEVRIPAGIADGQTIRISGRGEAPPRGGSAGDLYVTVHVQPHEYLQRQGDNVVSEAAISFVDAILGTQIEVATLAGKKEITIPPGTQPGTHITLRDQGFPSLQRSGRGDQVITIQVEIPKKISRQQRRVLEELRGAKKKRSFF